MFHIQALGGKKSKVKKKMGEEEEYKHTEMMLGGI